MKDRAIGMSGRFELDIPFVAQAHVLRITGVAAHTLQAWANRRIVDLTVQNPAKGRKRMYSTLDIIAIGVIREMTDNGVSPSIASEIANIVKKYASEYWASWKENFGGSIVKYGDPVLWNVKCYSTDYLITWFDYKNNLQHRIVGGFDVGRLAEFERGCVTLLNVGSIVTGTINTTFDLWKSQQIGE